MNNPLYIILRPRNNINKIFMPRKRLTSTKKKLLRLGIKTAFELIANAFLATAVAHPAGGRFYYKAAIRHAHKLGYDLQSIYNCFWRLKHFGYIEEFVEGKEGYLELTKKGRVRFARYGLAPKFLRPKRWDGKWRVLIYDVPEKDRKQRDRLKHHLEAIGFLPLQQSVYIFPFECTSEVQEALEFYRLAGKAVLLLAETLEGEDRLIAECIERGVLTKEHVRSLSR